MSLPGEHTAKLSAICTKYDVVLTLENGAVSLWTYSRPTGPPTSSPASAGHFSSATESIRRQPEASDWRTFRTHNAGSPCPKPASGSRIPALCLIGRYFGVAFLEYALRLLRPSRSRPRGKDALIPGDPETRGRPLQILERKCLDRWY